MIRYDSDTIDAPLGRHSGRTNGDQLDLEVAVQGASTLWEGVLSR